MWQVVYFSKHMTAYRMRMSDWSSDVGSSDLRDLGVVFLLSVLAAVSPRTATASKPFTTELMVQNQDVGEVRFSTDGRWIYLEQLLPYREKGYFDRERDWGRSLSVLSIVDRKSTRLNSSH